MVKNVPEGWCLVPLTLTAENGAKAALHGEFSMTYVVDCEACEGDGGGEVEEDDDTVEWADCTDCNGSGQVYVKRPIEWTTLKDIHRAMVAHFIANPPNGEKPNV